MPNTFYPAVCATRLPPPEGHATCARAGLLELDGGRRAHLCDHGYLLGACLVGVMASEIGPRLDVLAALLDPKGGV